MSWAGRDRQAANTGQISDLRLGNRRFVLHRRPYDIESAHSDGPSLAKMLTWIRLLVVRCSLQYYYWRPWLLIFLPCRERLMSLGWEGVGLVWFEKKEFLIASTEGCWRWSKQTSHFYHCEVKKGSQWIPSSIANSLARHQKCVVGE